jgi:hypothetical protein
MDIYAQDSELSRHPGFIDLSEIEVPDDDRKVTEISLGAPLLKLALSVNDNGDEDLDEAISGLFSIQVKSFEIHEDETKKYRSIIDKIEKKLQKENWQSLVRVKEGDEASHISIKHDKNKAVGLLIMTIDPEDEGTFVNIVGGINLKHLNNLNLGIDEDTLEELEKEIEKFP